MKNNEEKAQELYRKYRETDFTRESAAFNAAMEMAEWKDQQLKENERTTSKLNEEEVQTVVLEAIDKIKHTNGIKGAARFASMNYSVYEVAMEVAKVMNEKLSKE